MELSELSLSGGNGACSLRCGHWSSGQPSLRSKHSVEGSLPSCDVTRHDEADPRVHAGMRFGASHVADCFRYAEIEAPNALLATHPLAGVAIRMIGKARHGPDGYLVGDLIRC